MTDGSHPLDRAAELARREPVDASRWEETASGVMRRVRSTLRPGRTLRVPLPDERGAATFVNERVVVATLREAFGGLGDVALSDLRLEVAGDRLTELRVELVARYGHDLQRLGERCRGVVRASLAGLLLGDADTVDVRVSVVDVTLEDPRS